MVDSGAKTPSSWGYYGTLQPARARLLKQCPVKSRNLRSNSRGARFGDHHPRICRRHRRIYLIGGCPTPSGLAGRAPTTADISNTYMVGIPRRVASVANGEKQRETVVSLHKKDCLHPTVPRPIHLWRLLATAGVRFCHPSNAAGHQSHAAELPKHFVHFDPHSSLTPTSSPHTAAAWPLPVVN